MIRTGAGVVIAILVCVWILGFGFQARSEARRGDRDLMWIYAVGACTLPAFLVLLVVLRG